MAFFEADADSTALKATQDGLGNTIASTYVKGLSASGTTITVTKGDGTTSTITTQDTTYGAGTASALGLTRLYTKTGSNTNGTMTQAAITSALSDKAASSHNHDDTYLKLTGGTVSGNITATGFTGNLSGTATKLATARTIQTNLASTSYASFDGSNNITPGVTGILPMSNGGLGTSSADVARKNLVIAPIYDDSEPSANTYNGLIWIGGGLDDDNPVYETGNIDSALSTTSVLPVQNKVITAAINDLINNYPTQLTSSICSDLTSCTAFNKVPNGTYFYDGGSSVVPNAPTTYGVMIKWGSGVGGNNCALWFAQASGGVWFGQSNENVFTGWCRIGAEDALASKKLASQSLTASGGTLTWTDSEISDTTLIEVYATIPNISPSSITQSGTTVTVVFDAQDSAFDVCVTIRN